MSQSCTYTFAGPNGGQTTIKGAAAMKAHLASGGLEALLGEARADLGRQRGEEVQRSADRVPQTPEFRQWSGGHPVVLMGDSPRYEFQTGQPVVVEGLHGTKRDYDRVDMGLASGGYFLSNKPVVANEYAGVLEGRDNVVPFGGNIQRQYVRMDNPLVINARGASFNRIDTRAVPGFPLQMSNTDMINQWAKERGHDGVIYKDLRDSLARPDGRNAPPSNVYASLKPSYIKSATGNDGSYDLEDESFLSSRDRVTSTPEFKAWFGDSKVVDAEGRPLVVYHSTTSDFDEFKTDGFNAHFGASPEQANDRLLDREVSRRGIVAPGSTGRRYVRGDVIGDASIMPAYLAISRPLRMDDVGDWRNSVAVAMGLLGKRKISRSEVEGLLADAEGEQERYESGAPGATAWNASPENERFLAELRSMVEFAGYDGIVYKNEVEGEGDAYIAFEPEQIKSATGNSGAFDSNDPDITKSEGRKVEPISVTTDDREWAVDGKPTVILNKADFGNRSGIDWVDGDRENYVTSIGAYGDVRGVEMLRWLKGRTGKPAFAVSAVDDAIGFYERMGRLGLVTGYTVDPVDSFFGIDFGDGETPRYEGDVRFSAGRDYAGSPSFRRWFADSVMTENGKPGGEPLVLYHGGFDFAQAPEGKAVPKVNGRGALGVGFYMTPDEKRARGYAEDNSGAVSSLYVRMERPLEIRLPRGQDPMIAALVALGMDRDKAASKVESAYEKYGYVGAEVKNLALKQGYDGLVQYIDNKMSEVVVWSPTQVKSATDNNGEFSWNPDIRRSTGRARSDVSAAREAMDLVRRAESYKPEEGEDRVVFPILFHSGTGDPDSIARGVEPQFGSWVSEVLSGAYDEEIDADESFVPLSYFDSVPEWITIQVARKADISPQDVKLEDVRKHGQLAIVYNVDERFGGAKNEVFQIGPDGYNGGYTDVTDVYGKRRRLFETGLEEEGDYRSGPRQLFGVEPGDIVTNEAIEPDLVLVGDALVEFMRAYRDEINPDVRFSRDRTPLGFYSALARGVESMPTKSAPAGAWKAQIKGLVNKGVVKQDEVEWSGINDWLDLQRGKVTREAVAEYLKQGGVRVEESVLGGAQDVADEGPIEMQIGPQPKYSQYTLPGGTNYREVLLRLPSKRDALLAERAAMERRGALLQGNPNYAEDRAKYDDLQRQIVGTQDYKSKHWDQTSVLAHIRVNDRVDADGKRVLLVEELQSDFGSDTREQRAAIEKAVDGDFNGIVEKMKKAGVLEVVCD